MPFEGAGAVSRWTLSLPKNFRQFDYQTINDVILHISYTAEEDGAFRESVEELNAGVEGTLLNFLRNQPLARVFSLRQDFSSAFHHLLHSPVGTPVKIELTDQHFPIFLKGRNIQVSKALLVLATPKGQALTNVQISINGQPQQGFPANNQLGGLRSKDLGAALFAGGILDEHTLVVNNAGGLAPASPAPGDLSAIDEKKLRDVMLYLEYKVGP